MCIIFPLAVTTKTQKRKWSQEELDCYNRLFGSTETYITSKEIREIISDTILKNVFLNVKAKINSQCKKERKQLAVKHIIE